ncbi:MAG: DUF3565 domain-containing protein, partial [Alteromonadaceae bacterium]|nr:DUF3565 domain-containing protein [Alteromonadaceae bacterium]
MEQEIVGYHLDEENHWVAELSCGHNQHVRHNPPWVSRPWVITAKGERLGCRKLVFLGISNFPVFDFTKYDIY